MPVSPPYSIIDTIARLRASGGAAWGDAAKSVGQDFGAAGASIGKSFADKSRADTAQAQSGAQEFRSANDPSAAPVATPGVLGGGPAGTSATPGLDQASPLTPKSQAEKSHQAVLKFDQAHSDINHSTTAPSDGAAGKVNMAQWMKANGYTPHKGMENIWGTPKMTTREESQARTTQEEMRLASEEKRGENKAASAASLEAGKLQGRKELLKEQNDEKDKLKKQDALDKKAQEDQKAHDKQLETSARVMSSSDLAKAKSGYKKSENKAKWRTDHPIWAKGLDLAGMGDASESGGSVPVGQHDDDAAIDAALKASGGQ